MGAYTCPLCHLGSRGQTKSDDKKIELSYSCGTVIHIQRPQNTVKIEKPCKKVDVTIKLI